MLFPPLGYLLVAKASYRSAAVLVFLMLGVALYFSYAHHSRLEAMGEVLPEYWRYLLWIRMHLLSMAPWGFFLPMKVVYAIVLWHSISIRNREYA